MKNKKGDINISLEFVIHLFLAFIMLGVLAWAVINFLDIIEKKPEASCLNDKWWDNERGLKDLLKEVDKGKDSNFIFYNENCKLVSFSFLHGSEGNKIEYSHSLPREPILCLCMIESSILQQDQCKPYDCYTFKNYDQINTEQFSTKNLEKYVALKFTKDGKTLRVEALGTEQEPEQINYTKLEQLALTDPTGIINTLNILFKTNDIQSFTPIVKTKEQEFLFPEGISNIDEFTTFFDLELALPSSYGQSEEDYLNNHVPIDSKLVKEAFLILSISKEKYSNLTISQKQNINLYYKIDKDWKNSSLLCAELEKEVLCSAHLNEFSSNFAISTILENIS